MALPPDYPSELERELTLKDGSVVRIRPIQPDDTPRLQELHSRLSRQTAYHRFFSIVKRLPSDWARVLANVEEFFENLSAAGAKEVVLGPVEATSTL